MTPIISATELASLIDNENMVIVDARGGKNGHENYLSNHLKGAVYLDLDNDLSQKTNTPENGGRHPLPDTATFSRLLGSIGITPETHVVVYDNQLGANASSRLWWMLKAVGHAKVQVLNGGLLAAITAGLPVSSKQEQVKQVSPYPVPLEFKNTINIDGVASAAKDPDKIVIDVREAERFQGIREPIDLIAGHIPGAVNVPYISNLDAEGKFFSPQELKQKYIEVLKDRVGENIIVHCGSGVTACHTLLALEHAGISGSLLYVGSWSEWSRTGRPIAKS